MGASAVSDPRSDRAGAASIVARRRLKARPVRLGQSMVAVLIWAMVHPMMVAVDLSALKGVGHRPKGLVITVVVNWLIKPFTIAALGVLFFEHVFACLIDPADTG